MAMATTCLGQRIVSTSWSFQGVKTRIGVPPGGKGGGGWEQLYMPSKAIMAKSSRNTMMPRTRMPVELPSVEPSLSILYPLHDFFVVTLNKTDNVSASLDKCTNVSKWQCPRRCVYRSARHSVSLVLFGGCCQNARVLVKRCKVLRGKA